MSYDIGYKGAITESDLLAISESIDMGQSEGLLRDLLETYQQRLRVASKKENKLTAEQELGEVKATFLVNFGPAQDRHPKLLDGDESAHGMLVKVGEYYIGKESFFFAQDSDCHWYQIPSSLRVKWNEFTTNDIADDEFETLFGEYRTGGDISGIDFVMVK